MLVDIPEQPARPTPPTVHGELKLRSVNRQQSILAQIWVEELIAYDHKARAIWELVERMDLSRFTEPLRTTQGCAGRAACLHVEGYSRHVRPARFAVGEKYPLSQSRQWRI